MYTLGYSFKPWTSPKAIADGPSILAYLRETAREHGIDRKIRFGHRVEAGVVVVGRARGGRSRSSAASGEVVRFTCNFLFMCSGYYDYAAGYTPEFLASSASADAIVHPQQVDRGPRLRGQARGRDRQRRDGRDARAGDGEEGRARHDAAAVADVHRLAAGRGQARERAPSLLPARVAYGITRWKNVLLSLWFYRFCRRNPTRARAHHQPVAHEGARPRLRPLDALQPALQPVGAARLPGARQRPVPGHAREDRASIVTDQIETFTEKGLKLRSGAELEADIIVTATGLEPRLLLGGLEATVDGVRVDFSKTYNYKGMMFSDVPNLALAVGYTNASWTLKAGAHLPVRLPAPQPHDSDGHPPVHAATVARRAIERSAVPRPHVRLRAALDPPVPEAGREDAVASSTRTTRATS